MISAVLVGGLEVMHLLFQALDVFLDCFALLPQSHLELALWAGNEPVVGIVRKVVRREGRKGCVRLTSCLHPRRHWRWQAEHRVRWQLAAACGFHGSLCSSEF